jgi:RNA polymerase sigma factor (TIGR02999 family)
MATGGGQDITRLLSAWSNGEATALDELIAIVYPELRRIARKHLAGQVPAQTLESAALVNEAYLKLVRADAIHFDSRLQFFALCAQIIRHLLVDHARNRRYAKRGVGPCRFRLMRANSEVLCLESWFSTWIGH